MEKFICPFCHAEIAKKNYCPKCKRIIKDSDYKTEEEVKEPVKEIEPAKENPSTEPVSSEDDNYFSDFFGVSEEPKQEEKKKETEMVVNNTAETKSDKSRSYGFNYKVSGRSFRPEDTEDALEYLYLQGTVSFMFSNEKAGEFSSEFERIVKNHLADDEYAEFMKNVHDLFVIFSKTEERFTLVLAYLTNVLMLRINNTLYKFDRERLAASLANERLGSAILSQYLSVVYFFLNRDEIRAISEERQLQRIAKFVFDESSKNEEDKFVVYIHRDESIKVMSFGKYRFFTKELAKGEKALEKNWCLRTIGKIDKTNNPIPSIDKVPALITRMFNIDIESISEYFYNLRFASTLFTEIVYRDYYLDRNATLSNSEQRFIDCVYMSESNQAFGNSIENSALQLLYLLLRYDVFNVPESKFMTLCNYHVGNEKLVRIAQASNTYDVFLKTLLSRLPKNTIRFMGRNMTSAMFFKALRSLSTSQMIAYVSSFIDDIDGLEALQKVNNLEVVKRTQLENRLKGKLK